MLVSPQSAPMAFAAAKDAAFVIDANTGKVLYESKADAHRHPASLTKMMTLYMLFDAMKAGKVKLSTRIPMSAFAAGKPPSKLGIKPGQSITVETAIHALVIKSANDVAAAVGEHLGGSEAKFAAMMTRKARQLGMSRTTFRNASGLPDDAQVSTARDLSKLGMALREHFPQYYSYFGSQSWRFAGRTMRNHNRLVGTVTGVDGIKTGYIRDSGYNLVTSAKSGDKRIVAVVLGGRSGAARNATMRKLVEQYLPKASGKRSGPLIARAKTVEREQVALVRGKDAPIPMRKSGNPSKPAQIVASFAAATPNIRPKAEIELIKPQTDDVVTASIARDGWVIQIASLSSEVEARQMLAHAQDKAGKLLGNRQPFTEVFQKGGVTYHRARFAGFSSKDAAWSACEQLKKRNFGCLAFAN